MKHILLCSSDTLLVKNLYGVLRDLGFDVDTVEHPSHAVHQALGKQYDLAVVDIEPFGLSSFDAEQVLRNVAPDMRVITIGPGCEGRAVRAIDLEDVTRTLQAIAV
jgi:DNA-binding response OmpR family regulator